jgi:predicted nucleic acid-binding protein
MIGYLVDSNVLLDLITLDPVWLDWSRDTLRHAARTGSLLINPVIYAELCVAYDTIEALDDALDRARIVSVHVPPPALFLAARVHQRYRQRGGQRTGVLPDFSIGAHAAVDRLTLITRDTRRRGWFPTVEIVSPVYRHSTTTGT